MGLMRCMPHGINLWPYMRGLLQQQVKMINDFNLEFIIAAVEKASLEKNYNYFCTSRDIFQARQEMLVVS